MCENVCLFLFFVDAKSNNSFLFLLIRASTLTFVMTLSMCSNTVMREGGKTSQGGGVFKVRLLCRFDDVVDFFLLETVA